MTAQTHYVVERPEPDSYEVEHGERHRATWSSWSPAQFVGLVAGIAITVMGFVALARTGFDTDHIYSPHAQAWHLPHSPLMALIEVGFGVLVMVASVVPGGARSFLALLGAIALSFGIVVLVETPPNRLNHWLGVDDKNGWFYVVVGGVLLLAALISPVFTTRTRKRVVRDEQRVLA
jgi:hypothetical protein